MFSNRVHGRRLIGAGDMAVCQANSVADAQRLLYKNCRMKTKDTMARLVK